MNPKTKSLFPVNLAVFIFGGTAMFAKGIPLPTLDVICLRGFFGAAALAGAAAPAVDPAGGLKRGASRLGTRLRAHHLPFTLGADPIAGATTLRTPDRPGAMTDGAGRYCCRSDRVSGLRRLSWPEGRR